MSTTVTRHFGRRRKYRLTRSGVTDLTRVAGLLGFSWVAMDSMMTYFARTVAGVFFPVSIVLPPLIFAFILKWGPRSVLPPKAAVVWLMLSLPFFVGGMVMRGTTDILLIGAPLLAECAFVVGYFAIRWADSADRYGNVFLAISGAYVAVCIVALLRLDPKVFPLIDAVWSNQGVLEPRPEVMTDQNFQIFYLLSAVAVLTLPYRFWRFAAAAGVAAGSYYVLARLQSRSGMLVYLALLVVVWVAPLWTRSLGRQKMLVLPLLMLAVAIWKWHAILNISALLLARFHNTGAVESAQMRLQSITYLFPHLLDPWWWLPRGNEAFMQHHHGVIPHSNATAMLLQGGIVGFVSWVALFIFPLVSLARLFVRRWLDNLETMILIVGTASMVVQLSLNVPFFKQPWLWAGAVLGALVRCRARRRAMAVARAAARGSEPQPAVHPEAPSGADLAAGGRA